MMKPARNVATHSNSNKALLGCLLVAVITPIVILWCMSNRMKNNLLSAQNVIKDIWLPAEEDKGKSFMAAIEMIHTYSLIHDDLPALDNDDLRRGLPTAHVKFGEAMAILAGDALLNYAFETASKAFCGDAQDITTAKAMQILAKKPGIYGMIGGQTVDVEEENKEISFDTLMYIHNNKTAALIECAMMIGAVLAGASEVEVATIEKIANKVGIAFQIEDDILDVVSTSETLGKPAGSDEKNGKNTYVLFRGLEQSGEDAKQYTEEALQLFDALEYKNDFLRELLLYLVGRKN